MGWGALRARAGAGLDRRQPAEAQPPRHALQAQRLRALRAVARLFGAAPLELPRID